MTESSPTISVIIPTYNRAHWVCRAVQSILNQTYQDFEIIVVDDGSTDNTDEMIKEYQKQNNKVRYTKLKKNRGGAAARNRGFGLSHGKYIAFIDSDDEAFPMWFEKSIGKIQKLPDSWGVLYPRYCIQDDLTGIRYFNVFVPNEGYIYERLLRGEHIGIGVTGALVKKESFTNVGGFDEKLPGFHDYDFWYRLAMDWTFHFLNEPLILFHNHANARLMGDNELRKEAMNIFHDKWKAEIERVDGKNACEARESKFRAGSYFSFIKTDVFNNGRLSALKLLITLFSRDKFKPVYFFKNVLVIVIGPSIYLFLKRCHSILYWKYKKYGQWNRGQAKENSHNSQSTY